MHSLAQRVLSHIRRLELLHAGDRVGVAVSGGIDSIALLRLLAELRGELGIVVSVVHFNHKLRGAESDADQEFVADLARAHGLEFFSDTDDVAGHAAEEGVSVEAAARELRYGFFRHLIARDNDPQGLKPHPEENPARGPEGPLFHGGGGGGVGDGGRGGDVGDGGDGGRGGGVGGGGVGDGGVGDGGVGGRGGDGGGDGDGGGEYSSGRLDKIATGHTLDDQAETVLMRMIRGAGLRGLGAIHPRIAVENDDDEVCGEIVRPLLATRRRELEQYLWDIGQAWREDSSNADDHFTRNRVRKLVVPLLEKEFNPAVAENLAELAEIARGEEDYWENEVAGWMGTAVHWSEPEWARRPTLVQIASQGLKPSSPVPPGRGAEAPLFHEATGRHDPAGSRDAAPLAPSWLVMNASVDLLWFLGEPAAVQRRLVKAIGEQAGIPLEFKHVEEVLDLAQGAIGRECSLPLGWKARRDADGLTFLTPDLRTLPEPSDYDYELRIPGRTAIHEIGSAIEAIRISAGGNPAYNPENLLDAEALSGSLRVRNWRPGDRFWPAHTKSPRKIKELLQDLHVPQPERKMWPVAVSGEEVIWMRGFPVPAKFQARPGRAAVAIVEEPLG